MEPRGRPASHLSPTWTGCHWRSGLDTLAPAGRDGGPDPMIRPSRSLRHEMAVSATGAFARSRRPPQTTAGWAGESRPSPVIPLGKGEYSLRELHCSRWSC
jgi:hypothetical protein